MMFFSGSLFRKKHLWIAILYGGKTLAQPTLPDPYATGSKISYVRVWDATHPETNGNVFLGRWGNDLKRQTNYFDGLGRNIQTQTNGIIKARQYDKAGREMFQYLPYPGSNSTLQNDPFQQQQSWYQSNFSGEQHFYSKIESEQAPVSRINKSFAPGMSWVGSNRGVEMKSEFNTLAESIRIWNIDFLTGSIPYTSTVYPTGKLSKSVMLDEKGKKVYVYTDSEGKTILKKVQEKDTGPDFDENGYLGWLCTYYVYDDLGQLRSTVTPKAVKYLLQNGWIFNSSDVYQELCFWYEFDERGRAIRKHTPGAGVICLVYDNKDRLVLSQDENQRARTPDQWTFYLYDILDRQVATGLFDNNATRDAMELFVKNLNNGVVTISVYTGSDEPLTVDNPVAGTPGYCNSCNNTLVNSVYYYDTYTYQGAKPFNSNFSFAPLNGDPYGPLNPWIEPTETSTRVINMPTGSKTRVINENHDDGNYTNDIFLTATTYYDDKGRAIQSLSDNIKGTVDYSTTQYDFTGQVQSVCERQNMPSMMLPQNYQLITGYTYDELRRLSSVTKKIGDNAFKKIVSFQYDEFGRAKNKKLSPDFNSGAGIETLNYTYNLQGWLNGINKDWALANTSLNQWDHFFGMYMGYDNRDNLFTAGREQYNGNLAGAIWKTQGDNMPRKYEYGYDNANRFTEAIYKQKEKPTDANWNSLKMDFSVSNILYDENNNLKQMHQKGVIPGNNAPVLIDKLLYEYKQVAGAEWSNQLWRVYDQTTDLTATNNGSLGDFKDENYGVNADDYVYDVNGNLVKDNNKKIRTSSGNTYGVQYNFMDKPQKVTIESKSTTEFIYDANGVKHGKKVTNTVTGGVKTTWYAGSFIYEEVQSQTILTMILHEEGRIRVFNPAANPRIIQGGNINISGENDTYKGVYEYFIKDNLQNTHAIVSEETHQEYNNCTMEDAAAAYEERMFGQIDINTGDPIPGTNEVFNTRVEKQTWAPGWNSNTSQKVSKLSWYGKKVGPNTILKVMSGDEISTQAHYYYTGSVDNSGNNDILNPLLTSMLGVLSNQPASSNIHGSASTISSNYSNYPGELGTFLNSQSNGGNATPQAYLNVLFFDENFNFIPHDNITGLGSNAWRVSAAGDGQSFAPQLLKAPKNGYAFVYLSNESKTAVYFDNFDVTHIRGRLVEENAYYAYGLKIKGISARAFNKGDNRYGYQGDFSETDVETGWDEFDLRMYDAQIGRWTATDPYDEFAGPYIGMGSNPINFVDPDGGSIFDAIGSALTDNWVGTAIGAIGGAAIAYFASGGANGSNTATNTVICFIGGAILGNFTQEWGYRFEDGFGDLLDIAKFVKEINLGHNSYKMPIAGLNSRNIELGNQITADGSRYDNFLADNSFFGNTIDVSGNPEPLWLGPTFKLIGRQMGKAGKWVWNKGIKPALRWTWKKIQSGPSKEKIKEIIRKGREAYESEVRNLSKIRDFLRNEGKSAEEIARRLYQARRDLGEKFKNLTPKEKLKEIYQRNIEKYGDKLGPSIEWFRKQGKSWEDIIESAIRPGGGDLKF